MRIWIDLSNSPHPLLFEPVARRLEELGATVLVTARDNAQTVELAGPRFAELDVIGRESPGGSFAKLRELVARTAALRRWARGRRLDVALSHNSYAQLLAARSVGVPAVTAMDFEHQPANHIAFRAADLILLPRAIPTASVRGQGAAPPKVRRFDGLKEELYLAEFEPDASVLDAIGVERENGGPVVVARTPPSRATYHRFDNPLFVACLRALCAQAGVRCIVLPRHAEQLEELERLGLARCIIPQRAVDSRSLIREADLVVGAGGTMTREAALMGIPTISVFAGASPAVDAWLEGRGALRRLGSVDELGEVRRRGHEPRTIDSLRARGRRLQRLFVDATLDVAKASGAGR